jgi:hypothetical protein
MAQQEKYRPFLSSALRANCLLRAMLSRLHERTALYDPSQTPVTPHLRLFYMIRDMATLAQLIVCACYMIRFLTDGKASSVAQNVIILSRKQPHL